MTSTLDLRWFAERLTDASVKGIAGVTAGLIREGQIPIGTHLPSVRDLAEALGVSPATVSAAWGQLKRQKVIAGKGRSGVRRSAIMATISAPIWPWRPPIRR
jgi:DNA-binding transcriptional MocR family regulator